MPDLISMANIGREMERKLKTIGVDSPEKLLELGAEQVFFQLKEVWPQVCLVHLYALEGAIRGVEFNSLPKARKKELKEFSDILKGGRGAPDRA